VFLIAHVARVAPVGLQSFGLLSSRFPL